MSLCFLAWYFPQLIPADKFRSAVEQHSFGWLLGCHWPFDHCVHVVILVWVKTQKGRKRRASSPSASWLIVVV